MSGSAKCRQAAPCLSLLRLLPWWVRQSEGILQSTAKASAPRALQKHTLLIYEQHILWAVGVWIKTCRRIKTNLGVYMWAQVVLEIRGRLWAAMTISFFSSSTTPVAVPFQVMREGSSSMVFWDSSNLRLWKHCRSTAAGFPCEDTALAGKHWLFWPISNPGTKCRAHNRDCFLLALPCTCWSNGRMMYLCCGDF